MKKISLALISIAILACSNAESKTANKRKGASPIASNQTKKSAKDGDELKEISKGFSKPKTPNGQQISKPVKQKDLKQVIHPEVIEAPLGDSQEVQGYLTEKMIVRESPMTIIELPTELPIDNSSAYQEILSNNVSSSGKVNYVSIKKDLKTLEVAIVYYQENTPKSSWSTNQKLAYWINAYNLFTIKLVVDNYPTSSIKNISGGKPWDKKFIELDGKTMSLNDIENGIIRKQFNEPRIHFAVNCASVSCPKLLNQEYTSSNLNTLLDKQAKRYINDKNENTFTSNSAKISNIFDWYKDDFKGGVIPFLNKYLASPLPADTKISYEEYNWNLNN